MLRRLYEKLSLGNRFCLIMGVVLSFAFVPVFIFMVFLLRDSFSTLEAQALAGLTGIAGAGTDAAQQMMVEYKSALGVMKEKQTVTVLAAIFLCTAAVGLVMLVLLFVMFRTLVGQPLGRAVGYMKALAGGQMDVAITDAARSDEVGDIARALAIFRDSAVDRAHLQEAQALQEQQVKARAESVAALCAHFEKDISAFLRELATSTAHVQEAAEGLYRVASENSELSGSLHGNADKVRDNVMLVASLTGRLAASTQEISAQVGHANHLVASTRRDTQEAQQRATALDTASERINAILSLIAHVSHQTKLLALNATIEAARAGEAGKSFAVVAHEVKNLATQTSQSADEIAKTITDIKAVASAIKGGLDQVGQSVALVDDATRTISGAVGEQSGATQDITSSMEAASLATQDVSHAVVRVTEAAQTTGEASTSMKEAASTLAHAAEGVSAVVQRFLAAIKAA